MHKGRACSITVRWLLSELCCCPSCCGSTLRPVNVLMEVAAHHSCSEAVEVLVLAESTSDNIMLCGGRRYAWECQTQEGGWGLDGVLRDQAWKLRGIVNGIDLQVGALGCRDTACVMAQVASPTRCRNTGDTVLFAQCCLPRTSSHHLTKERTSHGTVVPGARWLAWVHCWGRCTMPGPPADDLRLWGATCFDTITAAVGMLHGAQPVSARMALARAALTCCWRCSEWSPQSGPVPCARTGTPTTPPPTWRPARRAARLRCSGCAPWPPIPGMWEGSRPAKAASRRLIWSQHGPSARIACCPLLKVPNLAGRPRGGVSS